jgi:hypothetical protein
VEDIVRLAPLRPPRGIVATIGWVVSGELEWCIDEVEE